MEKLFASVSSRSKVFYLFLFCFIGLLFAASLSALLFGTDAAAIKNAGSIRLQTLIQSVCMFLMPTYFLFVLSEQQPLNALGMRSGRKILFNIGFGAVIFFAAYPFTALLARWNEAMVLPEFMAPIDAWMREMENQAKSVSDLLLADKTVSGLMLNLCIMAGIAALAEEIFFRGALQQFLQRIFTNYHVAIWTGAIIFSAIHLQFYGFFPRVVLGALLGYLFYYSRNLWVPIVVHFLNNAIIVVATYRDNSNGEIFDYPVNAVLITLSVLSIFATILLFRFYKKRNIPNA